MVAKDNSPGTIYDAGDVIVRMGEVSEEMYFIVRGAVDVLGPDMETVWDSMSKGAFFGEVGAFKQGLRRSCPFFCFPSGLGARTGVVGGSGGRFFPRFTISAA